MFALQYLWKPRKALLTFSLITLCMFAYHIGSHSGNVSHSSSSSLPYNVENYLISFNRSLNVIASYLSRRGNVVGGGDGDISGSRRRNVTGYEKDLVRVLKESMEDPSILMFLTQPVINHHDFQYVHNRRNICDISKPDVLITVPSAPSNFERRQSVRNSRRELLANNGTYGVRLLFFIGRSISEEVQQKIDLESKEHDDIVQELFDDTYHNIRYKAVSMLRWASTFCPNVPYVIRTDDDVEVDVPPMIERLVETSTRHDNFILGDVKYGDVPARHPRSKWYLPPSEFPGTKLPPYALGGALGYPMLTVQLLYQAALRVPPVWLDDLYVTGICGPKIGAKLITDPAFKFGHVSPYHFV